MTTKTPVVLSNDNSTHAPLGHDNKLPTNAIPVSAENDNALTIKPDGLFTSQKTGLSTINHDYSLGGSGSQNDPLLVRISNLEENIIQTRQHADNSGGLYIWEGYCLQSVTHNNSLNGTGKSDDKLRVRISNKTGNSLQLIDNPTTGGGGLYTPPKETIKYATVSGPIICEGPDTPSAEIACGKFGNGVYWKKKSTLSNAKNGDNNILVYPQLWSMPCKKDGSPVPYQMIISYPLIQEGQTPYVYLYLICSEIPTHTIIRNTLYKAEIRRGIAITTPTGLDDVYEASNPGNGPRYILQYMYSA
ncbi:TPA: hypothetical protein JZG45_003995 [Escherichia coli]|nr:hypothetical protein [Escherichia coli]